MIRRPAMILLAALVLVVGLTPALVGEEKRARDQAAETVQGQVQNVAADQHQFVLKDQNGREWTLHIGRDAKVQVNGKDSRLADLALRPVEGVPELCLSRAATFTFLDITCGIQGYCRQSAPAMSN